MQLSRLDPFTGMEMVEKVDTATWLRLDPCTGTELVEKVDTATWLACATELSQLSRMKMESDIKKFRRDGSQYL
ncbi:unnamed protein product [Echinostoma caproni]|uniref:DUF3297 family protein n=1 Tax=Echinostoma caproni TaxID=27848 RepID=A0A183A1Y0_9TREM|nr:unnamed protein product [Echinostoma caproni]